MKYKIKYNYNTGDSFHTEEGIESELDLEWDNIDVAKANIKRIEEHYKQYKRANTYSNKRDKDVYGENRQKDWFVTDYPLYCLYLYTDDGKPWQVYAPWCGYFESLNFVEIIVNNDDMKYIP